jgi:hypothetical protein
MRHQRPRWRAFFWKVASSIGSICATRQWLASVQLAAAGAASRPCSFGDEAQFPRAAGSGAVALEVHDRVVLATQQDFAKRRRAICWSLPSWMQSLAVKGLGGAAGDALADGNGDEQGGQREHVHGGAGEWRSGLDPHDAATDEDANLPQG